MKIAVCQINPIVADFEHNISLIKEVSEKARQASCDLAVFPEMCITGYPPKDLLEKPSFVRENLKHLEALASETHGIALVCGYVDINPKNTGRPFINASAFLEQGRVAGRGGKKLLPYYDVFDETRYFEPAEHSLVFEMDGQRIGVTVCEDIWNAVYSPEVPNYDMDPVADLQERGIDLLVNISASPFYINKASRRLDLLKAVSERLRVPVIYCNQVGGNDELLFDGSSMVVDNRAGLVGIARQFESDLITWESSGPAASMEYSPPPVEESVLKGLVMGTRDYVSKCGFTKVLLGLSGGIDSSLVACIASEALGAENVMGVSMPSSYTSSMSREDSRLLAENLGIRFHELSIKEIYLAYTDALGPLFKGRREDITEENIQSRIRGSLLMAISNKFSMLLLATGNKSELAVGYCTLYGDLIGALAVISDIPKGLCYRIADLINRDREIIPRRVLSRPPSAELRPDQKDQDTLPPYDVLDDILKASVEDHCGLEEIKGLGHDPEVIKEVLQCITLSEYKRYQAPPGLKISSKAFGSGRRYPLARGKSVY